MQETKKYDFLDGLRGLAICFVLLSHIHYTGFEIWPFFNIWLIGVPLFFMISAYTLALSQDKKWIDKGWLQQFFIRRFFRIYPLYFFMMIIVFILWYSNVITNRSNFTIWVFSFLNLLSHLSFTNGFFQTFMNSFRLGEWSLFNEIFFYILFPLLFPIIRNSLKNTSILLIIAIWIYGMRNIVAWNMWLDSSYIYHFPLYHLIDFFLGFLLFHLHKKYFGNIVSIKRWYIASISIFLLFAWLLIAYSKWLYINHLLRLIILCGMSIWSMLALPWFQRIKSSVLCYLGKISYSLYLWNLLILCAIWHYNPLWDPIYNLILALVLLISVSSISYTYEEYGIALGRKFS